MTDNSQQDVPASDEPIIEGEIVSEESAVASENSAEDNSTIITSLDELIKSHISSIDRLQEEQKKLRDMLADGLNSDAAFKEVMDKVKEVNKAKAQARGQIMDRPGIIEVANKLKSLNAEVKEKQMSLSDYLLEYQRLTGANQIEGTDGDIREIIHLAKLVKKGNKEKS